MSIIIENVTKLYGEQKALNDVSFEIAQGDIVGFLGPNGAGKSTMMKIITGFIPQTEGKVSVNGLDTLTNSIEVRKMIGYLPENNPLYVDMYVKEYLGFVAGLYKIKHNLKSIVDDVIEKTGLQLEKHKKIGMLSKGYRQRVGIAQALIHDPKVLILDEPTTGLDPNQIIEIRNLISEVGKEKTIMLSTHIMQEVEAICDRIVIIDRGLLIANERVDTIHALSKGAMQTVKIEFSKTPSSSAIANLKSHYRIENETGNLFTIFSDQKEDIRPTLFQFAVDENLPLLTLVKHENKLEDVFRNLTQKKQTDL